jgi:diguanylate cyclase (GGDEF)-like protein/PAS domain S-box-containing protein/putative nucleotidyltransferase with HDIG domain
MLNKDLRSNAEEQFLKEDSLKGNRKKLSPEEASVIVHELEVHQIELETQNEELKRTYVELDYAKARYFDLYNLAPEGYLVVAEDDHILESNLTAANMVGDTRTNLLKHKLYEYIHKEDQDSYYLHRIKLFETLEPKECELRMLKKDGTIFWGRLKATVGIDSGASTCRLILSDITDRKQIEQDLVESEIKFKSLVMSMDQGLALHEIILDKEGKPIDYRFLDINESYTRLVGVTREMCIGKTVKEIMPDVEDYWIKNYGKVALTGEPSYYENYFETTGRYYSTYSYSPKKNQFAVLVSDITDRMKRENEINYLNYHDQLTGLYNRRFYEEELKRLDTERNLPLTIAMGDLNGLKLVNDSFGHHIGDELLKKVAEVIKQGCRADDIIARVGGDEFVIIFPNTDASEAEKVITRINNFALTEKVNNIKVSISFGYETKVNKKQNIEDIFKEAEDHMYRHKLYESNSIKSKTIDLIMNTLHENNQRELLHSKRVSEICEAIAKGMNLGTDEVSQIKLAGLMHDIGKIGIDEKVLNSTGKLDEIELKEIKRHPEISYRILSSCNEFSEIAEFVLSHHERWDGNGYPKGLKGEEILQQARIISIADAFDAMTTERTYKDSLSIEEALEEINKCAGTQFDPELAKLFIQIMKQQ